MAFCNNCGNQLKGSERFCAQCGADVSAKTTSIASSPSVAPTAAPGPVPSAAPIPAYVPVASNAPPVQHAAAAPAAYAPGVPGHIPGAYVPPAQNPPAQNKGILGTVFVVVIVAAIGYYFYQNYQKTHSNTNQPTTSTPPASQPGGTPTNPPSPGTGGNTALLQQQDLSAQWQATGGFLLVTAKWSNGSTVNLSTAVMECDQYDANGTELSQFRVTLNGPTPANTWSSYSNIKMGAVANGLTKLACRIAHVTPAS
jgi:hypothetical protein